MKTEIFEFAGYNGIIFPSAKMDGGKNIVLFERALNLISR